jgi:hypothetical protein
MRRTLTLVLAALAATACRSKEPDRIVIDRSPSAPPSTIVIEKDHAHGSGCGHYYYNGRWYAEPEHIHVID